MNAALRMSTRRAEAIKAGKCTHCFKRVPVEGLRECAPCAERRQELQNASRIARSESGLCRNCGAERNNPAYRWCEFCRLAAAAQKRRERSRA